MSDVHVHTDAESDTISRSLNARAFTIGSDVFLTKGIDPEGGGRDAQTMAHELTHVVQQGGHGGGGRLKLGAADTAQEHEAESTAQREFDPRLKEDEDTIQRGFWDSLSSAIGTKLLDSVGMNEAYDEFMGGDKKVKAAIGKMPQAKKADRRRDARPGPRAAEVPPRRVVGGRVPSSWEEGGEERRRAFFTGWRCEHLGPGTLGGGRGAWLAPFVRMAGVEGRDTCLQKAVGRLSGRRLPGPGEVRGTGGLQVLGPRR